MNKEISIKHKKGGAVVYSFENGGAIKDTCYVNYLGYEIQNRRCSESGTDFFILGEYRDVAKMLRTKFVSEWIYYNRLSRLFISEEQAQEFVKQCNDYFNPLVKVNGFYIEHDRSFAQYRISYSKPMSKEIVTGIGTERKPREYSDKYERAKMVEREERIAKQEPIYSLPNQWTEQHGLWWWIGLVVNIGGEGDYGDKQWKNKILDKHIPENEGISLMTLVHEMAHCLDFNRSIRNNEIEYIPYGELQLASGTDFYGNPLDAEVLKEIKRRNEAGEKTPTILAIHSDRFVFELSQILRAGMGNKITILNEIENQAHEIEKEIGGEAYAKKQRAESRNHFLEAMKKKIEKANTPTLTKPFPLGFEEFSQNTKIYQYVSEGYKDIQKEQVLEIMPFLSKYKDLVTEKLYANPTRQSRILKQIRELEKDMNRLVERT
jgi:hypothetical protein